MLRTRLLYGLLTLVLLLWAVGGAGLVILRDAGKRYNERLEADYEVIERAYSVRSHTSRLNTHYLPSLAGAPREEPMERAMFDQTEEQFIMDLARLETLAAGRPRWESIFSELQPTVARYFTELEEVIDGSAVTPGERAALLQRVGTVSQRVNDLAESLGTLAEENLFAAARMLSAESGRNTLFIATLVALGTAIASIIYFQLVRQLVDPVIGLRQSIEEVRKGNFELTLPRHTRDSEFNGLVNAFNDMAAELHLRRRETDQRLMRNNLFNRALLSAIPSPVYVLSSEAEVVQINPAAEALNDQLGLGSRLPAKIGRLLARCRERDTNMLPEDPREALLFRINDEERFYLPRIFRFSSQDDQLAPDGSHYSGWAILLHDVTRIRWLDDMKTNMLSTVSHEIKTPLTGIRMVLHLMLEEDSSRFNEMQRTMLASAYEDCERLLSTLNTLLDLSRAESGTTHLDRSPLDLGQLVAKGARLFESAARPHEVRLRIEREDGELPLVFGDEVRLCEVINNLISNAIKHSPQGGEVVLSLTRSGSDYLRLSVIDDGPGVEEEHQQRIFERFFRAPGQSQEGVGLGLFISREIMRAHEGRIGLIDQDTSERTEFFIDVPLA